MRQKTTWRPKYNLLVVGAVAAVSTVCSLGLDAFNAIPKQRAFERARTQTEDIITTRNESYRKLDALFKECQPENVQSSNVRSPSQCVGKIEELTRLSESLDAQLVVAQTNTTNLAVEAIAAQVRTDAQFAGSLFLAFGSIIAYHTLNYFRRKREKQLEQSANRCSVVKKLNKFTAGAIICSTLAVLGAGGTVYSSVKAFKNFGMYEKLRRDVATEKHTLKVSKHLFVTTCSQPKQSIACTQISTGIKKAEENVQALVRDEAKSYNLFTRWFDFFALSFLSTLMFGIPAFDLIRKRASLISKNDGHQDQVKTVTEEGV